MNKFLTLNTFKKMKKTLTFITTALVIFLCSRINGQTVSKSPSPNPLWTLNNGGDIFRMSKVGILTSVPNAELDINGNVLVNSSLIGKIMGSRESKWVDPDFLTIRGSVDENSGLIMITKGNNLSSPLIKIINKSENGAIQFFAAGHPNVVIRKNDFVVGNGNVNVDMKVNGKIWSHEVEVKDITWWDEVFNNNYRLMPLNDLEIFVKINKHLPDIPTEKDVMDNGIELGKMNALLLKKVEELTLYTINQQNEFIKQKKMIEQQQKEIDELRTLLLESKKQ